MLNTKITPKILYLLSLLLVALLFVASLSVGVANFHWADLLSGSLNDSSQVLMISRLPRTFAIVLVGASMAVAGMIMQILLKNRFVEPSMVGASQSAALGLLRAELVVLLGLMVLLVLRPVSWVPFVGLLVMAGLVGRVRFMRLVRRRCWWLVAGVGMVLSWPAVVAVFLPATAPLGVRVGAAYLVMIVACWVLGVARFAAGVMAGARVRPIRPGEYVVVPEEA